jgi:acetyl esterase/lipase
MSLYRGMDRAALDAAYDNSAAVPGAEALIASWHVRSAEMREWLSGQIDLPYGPAPRQTIDWFPVAEPGAPTLAFIHGGYWQWCRKEDFTFVAEGPLHAGFNVAFIGYTLAPEISLDAMAAEIEAALDFLCNKATGRLCLAGHSAGGHLAMLHRSHPAVSLALGISGIYELEPIRLGRLNDGLGLGERDVAGLSPIRHIGPGAPSVIAVGAIELPELRRQSGDYAAALKAAGEDVALVEAPGFDHFSVLDILAMPESPALEMIAEALR